MGKTTTAKTTTTSSSSGPTRAAVYTRISSDPEGRKAGVNRQRADCLKLADREGLAVVGTYEDNDVSAFARRRRPGFERLLADAKAGYFEVIIVWATDRLYRWLTDLERIVDELAGLRVEACRSGRVDLSTADGRQTARILASVAQGESEKKGERLVARARQRTEVERRMTSSSRPFGWAWADPCPGGSACRHMRGGAPAVCPPGAGLRPRVGSRDGLVIDPVEAPALARAFEMFADGASLRAVTRWLNAAGWRGTGGCAFTPETVRILLRTPRHAGLVRHGDRVVAEAADGLRVVPVELFQAVAARLSDPSRRTNPGRPANTLMSGIAVCGKCGGPMNASNKHTASRDGGGRVPVYICARKRHVTRRRPLVDEPVLTQVGAWLARDGAAVAAMAAPASSGEREHAAALEVAALSERLDTLAALAAAGELDPADFAMAAKGVRARLVDAQARAAVVVGRPAVTRLLAAADVPGAWAALVDDAAAGNVEPLRALLREVLDRVVVNPAAVPLRPSATDLTLVWAEWVSGGQAASVA